MSDKSGAIFAVTSAKGGVGKSFFAANFAVALMRETRGRAIVVDMDLAYCGDAAAAFGMAAPRRAMTDLAPLLGSMSPGLLKGFLDTHASGVTLLPALHGQEEAQSLGLDTVAGCLALLSRAFDLVVVDLPTGLNPHSVTVMENCSHLFVLLTPELMAINHTRRGLEDLQALAFPRQMISVVLNRFNPKGPFGGKVVAKRLGREVKGLIPDAAGEVADSLTEGVPLILDSPRHAVSRALDDLAARLWSEGVAAPGVKLNRPTGVVPDQALAMAAQGAPVKAATGQTAAAGTPGKRSKIDEIKLRIHDRLLEEVDLRALDQDAHRDPVKLEKLKSDTRRVVDRLVDEEADEIEDRNLRRQMAKEILNEALGLGPIEALLEDDGVTEIMCNGPGLIYAERGGKLEETRLSFLTEKHLRATIERIVAPLGRRIDEMSPMVDARLSDGSRVNAVIPPLAVDGALLTIRKFSKTPLKVDDLIGFGSMNKQIAELLRSCVRARLNVLISGGTGSGKTTLLNVLSDFIPEGDRIVTIEDSAELQLSQRHVCRLESRPPSLEGTGEVTIRDLVKNALRMRPDRIVVGECRGAEALDMLQAMNTGHDGSLTTIHANNPRDSLSRLETLVMFAGFELPSRAIREQVTSAIDLVVQQSRFPDGTRKITAITEVSGMESDVITLQDIFTFQQRGMDENGKVRGRFVATGFIPRFMTVLEEKGFKVPRDIFMESL